MIAAPLRDHLFPLMRAETARRKEIAIQDNRCLIQRSQRALQSKDALDWTLNSIQIILPVDW